MLNEIEKNGYSDFTLSLEAAARGIREIIELNNIEEKPYYFFDLKDNSHYILLPFLKKSYWKLFVLQKMILYASKK